jgi:hypothetical protein
MWSNMTTEISKWISWRLWLLWRDLTRSIVGFKSSLIVQIYHLLKDPICLNWTWEGCYFCLQITYSLLLNVSDDESFDWEVCWLKGIEMAITRNFSRWNWWNRWNRLNDLDGALDRSCQRTSGWLNHLDDLKWSRILFSHQDRLGWWWSAACIRRQNV